MILKCSKVYKFLLIFFLVSCVTLSGQNAPVKHLVQKGETLYSLSVNYGVTVDQILKANKDISVSNFKVGMIIEIPSGVSDNEYLQHVILKKETLWSISQKYGISIDQLKKANPQLAPKYKLKKGKTLYIPIVKDSQPKPVVKEENKTVTVALILPFSANGIVGERCIEFYRGFLMATEVLMSQGVSINVYAYDEPASNKNMSLILDSVRKSHVDLMIAPLYFEHFNEVVNFAKNNRTRTIIPFSSKITDVHNNEYIYMLNAPEEFKNNQIALSVFELCKNDRIIFMLDNNGNELVLMHHLRNHLIKNGVDVVDLVSTYSEQDLLNACHSTKRNVLLSSGSEKQTFMKRMQDIDAIKQKSPNIEVACLGFPEWLNSSQYPKMNLHKINTYVFTNNYYDENNHSIKSLEKKYMDSFYHNINISHPNMVLLGHDCATYFIEVLNKGTGESISDFEIKNKMFQSNLKFSKVSSNGGFVNSGFILLNYQPNGRLEKINY